MTAGVSVESAIASHYATESLLDRIAAGLGALGKDWTSVTADDLKPVDEFHIGGLAATEALLDQLNLQAGQRVLDIGCGIGGTARHLVRRHGVSVHGVDLTPEFVETARALCAAVGVPASFEAGSATDLPVPDHSFDVATLIHVGMNVEDKQAMFEEAARVLRPGGAFAIYDVMAQGEEPIDFPVPWSTASDTSFLATPRQYALAADAAGFRIVARRDRGDYARQYFDRLAARAGEGGPPPVGLPLIMGEDAAAKIANLVHNLQRRRIAPVEMICRLPN